VAVAVRAEESDAKAGLLQKHVFHGVLAGASFLLTL
jgi:hypothetical protein